MPTSAASLLVKIGADVSEFNRGMAQVTKQVGGLKKLAVLDLFNNISSNPLVQLGKDALVMSSQFETAFIKIKNLTDTNSGDLGRYQDSVKRLSTQVGVSSLDLAQGLYSITSAGASGKVALDILEIAAKGAAIGMGETNDIARALTGTINAYGPANLSAAKAAEILFKTTKQGALEINELTGALSNVTPLAATMGVSMEEVGAFLATVSLNGTGASEGVTQLRSVLDAIINPSEQAAKILDKMGLSLADIQETIRTKGLRAALLQLEAGFNGNTTAIAQFFGRKEATIGFLSALGTNSKKYGDILKQNTTTTDQFGKATEESLESSESKWKKFTAELANDQLVLGDQLKKFILNINDALGSFDRAVQRLGKKIDLDQRLFGQVDLAKPKGAEAAQKYLDGFGDKLRQNAGFIQNALDNAITAPKIIIPDINGPKVVNFNAPAENPKEKAARIEAAASKAEAAAAAEAEAASKAASKAKEAAAQRVASEVERAQSAIESLYNATEASRKELEAWEVNIGTIGLSDFEQKVYDGTVGLKLLSTEIVDKTGFYDKWAVSVGNMSGALSDLAPKIGLTKAELEKLANTEALTKFQLQLEEIKKTFQGIGEASVIAFAGIAADILTGGLALRDLGKAALDAARQIVKAALAESIAGVIAKAIGKFGLLGIGVAVAGVALIS